MSIYILNNEHRIDAYKLAYRKFIAEQNNNKSKVMNALVFRTSVHVLALE